MKIVFFAPYSATWNHAWPEAWLANQLQSADTEIVMVHCKGVFHNFCMSMASVGLNFVSSTAQKAAVCGRCKNNQRVLSWGYGLKQVVLDDYLDAAAWAAWAAGYKAVSDEACFAAVYQGIPIGRNALYQLLLRYKKNTLNLTDAERTEYWSELEQCFHTVTAAVKILEKEKPDSVVTYNALYAANRSFLQVAAQKQIRVYFIHTGLTTHHRLQTLMLAKEHAFAYFKALGDIWEVRKALPVPLEKVQAVQQHVFGLLQGTEIVCYSQGFNASTPALRTYYQIPADHAIVCATLSSYDERFAGQTLGVLPSDEALLFPDMVAWVQALVDDFAQRDKVTLMIRVHPRDFPNRFDAVKSQQAQRLEKIFAVLPENVKVNWPSDPFSLFHFAKETSVFLNAWSTAGKEMALLGIPVITYAASLLLYPSVLNTVVEDKTAYFETIQAALKWPWQSEKVQAALRWHALEFVDSYLQLPVDLADLHTGWRRWLLRVWRKLWPLGFRSRVVWGEQGHQGQAIKAFFEENKAVFTHSVGIAGPEDLHAFITPILAQMGEITHDFLLKTRYQHWQKSQMVADPVQEPEYI